MSKSKSEIAGAAVDIVALICVTVLAGLKVVDPSIAVGIFCTLTGARVSQLAAKRNGDGGNPPPGAAGGAVIMLLFGFLSFLGFRLKA